MCTRSCNSRPFQAEAWTPELTVLLVLRSLAVSSKLTTKPLAGYKAADLRRAGLGILELRSRQSVARACRDCYRLKKDESEVATS